MITDPITYNVRERGRQFRGKDRNFDLVALARLINSAPVQEVVKHGDMHGFFGHWPRVKFGMQPAEGGIVDGKAVSVPVALRTVELSADEDGNVTHREEFLDTAEGRIAERLYRSKAGGFSSAIDAMPGSNPEVPLRFYGFDYVLEPNYTTNRGHKVMLDGIAEEQASELSAILDAVLSDAENGTAALARMYEELHQQHVAMAEAMARVTRDNAALVDRLARRGGTKVLDAVTLEDVRMGPLKVAGPEDYGRFRDMPLAAIDEPKETAKPQLDGAEARYLLDRYGRRY